LTKSTKSLTMSHCSLALPHGHDIRQRFRAARRRGPPLQPPLHAADRRAAGWLLAKPLLAEARVLYELARRDRPTAPELAAELALDHGYLSRILRGFNERGFITKTPSPNDRRQSLLSLTAKGRMAFAPLDQRSQNEIAAMIGKLSVADQDRIVAAMH